MTLSEIIKELQKYEKDFSNTKVYATDWENCHLVREVKLAKYPSGKQQIEFRIWQKQNEPDK